jgi:arylsulfatase A-like enzyme
MLKKKYMACWLLILTIFVLPAVFGNCKKSRKLKEFNVVLIVIDTLRSDHLPFYGYKKNTAPFLWELSKKSVVFKNAFSASSWTSPATASIFTSLYPYQHGVLMGLLAIRNAQKIDPDLKVNKIPDEIKTITEVLKEIGYQTYGVSDNLNIGKMQGFTQGFDKFRTFMYNQAPAVNKTIKKWQKKLMANGKYFLYIHYMEPHAPYHSREPWYKPHEDKQKDGISAYDSEINFVDQHIKELFELFQWEKNTLIIVTADHGEGLWDHGYMAHGKTLYREEVQVPLIIYLPGGTASGQISTNVSTIDILPTVRELIGLPEDKNNEGVSLVPLIKSCEYGHEYEQENSLNKRNLFCYLWVKTSNIMEWKSTIYKSWHFVIKLPKFRQLYSLLLDKEEKVNKIEKGEKIARQLETCFNDFMKKSKKYKQKTTKYKLDKKKTDKLKTLGYVQ